MFLSCDCVFRIIIAFVPDEERDAITGSKSGGALRFMLVNAPHEIVGNAEIKGAMFSAGDQVNIVQQDGTDGDYGFRAPAVGRPRNDAEALILRRYDKPLVA